MIRIDTHPRAHKHAKMAEYVTELLKDNGEALSASSVAVVFDRLLVVGPVMDDHILVCSHSYLSL